MMYLDNPPRVIQSRVYTSMPEEFRRRGTSPAWAKANKGGHPVDCFIEGPSFDKDGNLYIVDIPYGRIFRISPDLKWTQIAEYDGQPNGLKFHPDGRILIADYARGLLELNPETGDVSTILSGRNGESFKGINDLNIASNGDIYFTDQGQTGLQDQTGRVYLLKANGDLQCLLNTGISPNGLTLDRTESVLFVAMTRDNAVWRMPLTTQGGTAKVGRFCSMFGTSGPDGVALDNDGNIAVAHASLGHVFLFAPNGELIARVRSAAGPTCTNVAYGGPERKQLFITESSTGTVLVADMDVPGFPQPRA
ncbi:SMP-30/gluconolactonase/LRE family protein [Herbaspirillum sp. LeCh32-8]|uniref:SMP-30/gluconolactonase/LRE family protein n=1 Tax=Herbaspirillum sp. LeCh32-8 TaxID=2821356 RepID=UPI001AEA725D|nr:SMP-30/gluconolactonase/LRE family protein [Herbaspirillum sp. LeCh32-8]MBP0597746.1 SMP-30/gluconolactonase/LRE family protein [Herbaspirillum sp. LeCh32-8]